MPCFNLPFILKTDFTKAHYVCRILPLLEYQKLITAGLQGDIIIWETKDVESLEPKLFLIPSLDCEFMRFTSMTLLKRPINYYTDKIDLCLVTAHSDNRIRMWDIDDGRCFNISPQNIFGEERSIIQMTPLKDVESRFLGCLGESGKFYIFDLWKMRIKKSITVSKNKVPLFHINREKKEILFFDDESNIIIWDFSDYFKEEYNEYMKYYKISEKIVTQIKNLKETFIKTIKLPGNIDEKLRDVLYDTDCDLMIFLFATRILVADRKEIETKTTVNYFMNINFNNLKSLQSVFFNNQGTVSYILITTPDSNLTLLPYEDILYLWNKQKLDNEELNFNFSDFSFFKEARGNQSYLTLNAILLVRSSDRRYLRDDSETDFLYELSAFDKLTGTFILYDQVEESLGLYECDTDLNKYKDNFKFIDHSNNAATPGVRMLKSIANVLAIRENNRFINSVKDSKGYTFLTPYLTYTMNKEKKSKIEAFEYIQSLFDSDFSDKFSRGYYGLKLFESPEYVKYTSCTYLPATKTPAFLLGTSRGTFICMPMYFDSTSRVYNYWYLKDEKSNSTSSSIKFIHHDSNYVFICNERDELIVVSCGKHDLLFSSSKKQIGVDDDENRRNNSEMVGVDIGKSIQARVTLNQGVKCFMKIKNLKSVKNEKGVEDHLANSLKNKNKLVAIVLNDNSVIIFSIRNMQIEYELQCLSNDVTGVYIHPILDYIMVVYNTGELGIWSLSNGIFERLAKLDEFQQILMTPEIIDEYSRRYRDSDSYENYKEVNKQWCSKIHIPLEYSSRNNDACLDYIWNKKDITKSNVKARFIQERVGPLDPKKLLKNKDHAKALSSLNYSFSSSIEGNCEENNIVFLKLLRKDTRDHVIIYNTKDNSKHIKNSIASASTTGTLDRSLIPPYYSFISHIFPWKIEKNFDKSISSIMNNKFPVFILNLGTQGMGESFSFLINSREKWSTSIYMSTKIAFSIFLFNLSGMEKDPKPFTNFLINTFLALFRHNNKSNEEAISLTMLAKYVVNVSGDVMHAACCIILSLIKTKGIDYEYITNYILELFDWTVQQDNSQLNKLSISETTWLLVLGYASLNPERAERLAPPCIKRIAKALTIKNCEINPNLVGSFMKLFIDALPYWKNYFDVSFRDSTLQNLIIIYFHYYSIGANEAEKIDESPNSKADRRQYNTIQSSIFEIEKQSFDICKKMKNLTIRGINGIGYHFIENFISILKREILNTTIHPHYPTCIIDIIRHFVKAQNLADLPKHLHVCIEIILKTIDPNNPNMRKNCHKPATHALHTIFKSFQMVTFHQNTQKFAVGTSNNLIILYDLRTAVKWKVLEGHNGPVTCMSFDESGKHLASFSIEDSTLRLWRVAAAGFIGSILGVQNKSFKTWDIPNKTVLRNELRAKTKIVWGPKDKTISLVLGEIQTFLYNI